jgi:hypothetical protein
MALGADRILICRGLQVIVAEGSMRVVTIAALHQTFIHLVVKRHIEKGLDIGVALEAESRL